MSDEELTREAVDAMPGAVVLEFGASWCGYCQGAAPHVAQAMSEFPELTLTWIEDGKGKRLGRSFGVKLWPTIVVLRDGKEVARVVRPKGAGEITAALSASRA